MADLNGLMGCIIRSLMEVTTAPSLTLEHEGQRRGKFCFL